MNIRFGIIGMGGIGTHHAQYLADHSVQGASLAAFSTRDPQRLAHARAQFPAAAPFSSHTDLIASKTCDALLICTPHFQHPAITRDAFAAGLHVLVEKPLAVSISQGRRLVEASRQFPHLRFGIMLNQRANPLYQKIRDLLARHELGTLQRITWIATHWFRPNAYFSSSPWRATWAGEGGGVLINQAHHTLDLLYWITGLLPSRITAVGSLGKHHPIQTEDEVSAILEYPDSPQSKGPIGHFITSTAEAPGTNRLEIAGTRATLLAENNHLTLTRNLTDSHEFLRSSPELFSAPKSSTESIPISAPTPSATPEHKVITQDFTHAILHNLPSAELIAPAADSLPALELSNALLQSAITRTPISLPLDGPSYDAFLARISAP